MAEKILAVEIDTFFFTAGFPFFSPGVWRFQFPFTRNYLLNKPSHFIIIWLFCATFTPSTSIVHFINQRISSTFYTTHFHLWMLWVAISTKRLEDTSFLHFTDTTLFSLHQTTYKYPPLVSHHSPLFYVLLLFSVNLFPHFFIPATSSFFSSSSHPRNKG